MRATFSYDVFLSHNVRDKPRVRALAERLKQARLKVWFDEWAIKPGDDIYLAVERGLEAARVQLLCLSPAALASDWVALERSTVLFRDPANRGRRFVPVLLADCSLPDSLRRYKYLDFRDDSATAFEELLEAIRDETNTVLETPSKQPKKKVIKGKVNPRKKSAARIEPLVLLERKLVGHEDWVRSVAVSPDGTWIVSGAGTPPDSNERSVKIWESRSGNCLAVLEGHTGPVQCVTVTPDGKRILSASYDESIRVWDVATMKEIAKLEGHFDQIWSVIALGDNQRVFSGGLDGTLRLWDLDSGLCEKVIICGTYDGDHVFGLAVNSEGTRALSGHRDGRVLLWNLETGQCLATLHGHSGIVYSVQITPDGQFAISGSEDKTVKIWDLNNEKCTGTLEGHKDTVQSVAISPDGNLIASVGFVDESFRLWDLKTGLCLCVIASNDHESPVSITFNTNGSRLVLGAFEGAIYIYRLRGSRSARTEDTACRYVNAKVVLLGEGTVGKTSLAHRLIDDEYVVKDRTHGMNVWRLDLPPDPSTPGEGLEREALLWDLAGQEDYRLVHRLFLDQTALALLLINPQKDDPFAETGDWLKALDTAAANHADKRRAKRLLIFSQTDAGGLKLSDAKIERFATQHGFAGWLATSAKTGENCSDLANARQPSRLKQLIADTIPWDTLPWTATPNLLAELKNALLAMRDYNDIRLLRYSELAQRLEQVLAGKKIEEAEVRTAVTLLANHGLARPLKFGDLVLLQPELLNGYAGAVIRAARAHRDEIGCVQEADIYAADFNFTGVERLPRADEELLLRALVQTFLDHSLCIAEDTPQSRQLVFPSQYRREKDLPWQPGVFVSDTFCGEWQTVWTTLIVRLWYSHEFAHKELWRNAAEFNSSRGQLLGLKIDNRRGEGEATISLFFDVKTPDELKVILIEYVHRHLERYGCGVIRDRRYVCAVCATPVIDLEAVRKRFAAGKDFIICQHCDEKVPLVDFIEQRLKSDPVARKILAMEENATRRLDNQALEQILIGHVQAIAGEANQIFRPVTQFDYGIDGEIEFKDDRGRPSGKKIYLQMKSGNAYLRTRRSDGKEVFDVQNHRHLEYWLGQPVDVYLVIRQTDERTQQQTIRWMNITRYLQNRDDKSSRQVVFEGEAMTMEAVWRLRDEFFPSRPRSKKLANPG
ncbi:TIR domain-containing protein [Methylomonas sp. UP202]|uniref:TIR domain-containing protein n=1 Tax=Methylomonas sp. UP202 TaxID=3040943 RepID=UPI0024785221|nr:TIR domain-containing protein [Methylomonas sp. UP202]WGS84949.1 TIR domain-containing protein [Methylomonas sp. UP202]